MTEAYGAFAFAYDRGLGERFFKAVKRPLDKALHDHPTALRTHLDLACGTGLVVQHFQRKGWVSTGVDASVAMLGIARDRGSRFVAGDLRALPLGRTFARITCLYDSLNHMTERDDLVAAFRSVRTVMDADSLFLFDVNHPEIYPVVWGLAEPYVSNSRVHRLQIATSYRRRERMGRAVVTGWAQIGDRRVEIHEVHRQRAYSERDLTKALGEGGLEPVEVIDFDPFEEGEEVQAEGVKMFFVCRAK
ncbi:MAG: class I SAM-dependent methyltransferase [Thermoanaerobaculia bacterium]